VPVERLTTLGRLDTCQTMPYRPRCPASPRYLAPQAGFVVGPVGACVDGDVAVAIYGPQGRESDAVAEDLFRRESADRLGSGEFSLDIIDQSSGSKAAIQASISWPLQAARWRAMAGGRSLVISLGMAGSIEFGEKRCCSVVTPAGSPT
jgi:hypothetical protein